MFVFLYEKYYIHAFLFDASLSVMFRKLYSLIKMYAFKTKTKFSFFFAIIYLIKTFETVAVKRIIFLSVAYAKAIIKI